MIDGFRAYKMYLAVKLHFTHEGYDIIEQGTKTKQSRVQYEKRRDRGIFEILARKYPTDKDVLRFYIANFAYMNMASIWDVESVDNLIIWNRRRESITNVFRDDVDFMIHEIEDRHLTYNNIFIPEDCNISILLDWYLKKKITVESMVILRNYVDFIDLWDPMIMLWHDQMLLIRRLKPFVTFNRSRMNPIWEELNEMLM